MIESQNAQGFSGLELQMPILDENPAKKYNQNQESSSVHPQELLFAQTVNTPSLMRIV